MRNPMGKKAASRWNASERSESRCTWNLTSSPDHARSGETGIIFGPCFELCRVDTCWLCWKRPDKPWEGSGLMQPRAGNWCTITNSSEGEFKNASLLLLLLLIASSEILIVYGVDTSKYLFNMQSSMADKLEKLVNEATELPTHQIPGLVFQCVNRRGEVLCSTASGNRGLQNDHPMTMDTLFWIASCTKMITAIALMQLVEQGKADLDDADLLEHVLPELKEVKILRHDGRDGQRVLQETAKRTRITLKMLATHTSKP